jgi:ABC-type polysaccharide/polyol phosphate export permease
VSDQSGARTPSGVVHVFEPHEVSLPPLRAYLADLYGRRQLIVELAHAEVRGQRSTTFLGELWTLVDPVFQAAIYWFLFATIRSGSSGGVTASYITTIISSVFLWNYTRISIGQGGRAVLNHRGLVANAIFPRALLPIAEVYKGLLATIPAMLIYIPLHVVLGGPITAAVLVLPLLLVLQSMLNLGAALLLTTATTYFSDVGNLINYLVRLLTFATPVVYPVTLLTPTMRAVLAWNPFFALFTSYQSVTTGITPSLGLIAQTVLWAIVLLVSGSWVFLRHERAFALHV